MDHEDLPFEYETEHTVLRNNNDYGALLKYIVQLENMRVKAIKDIEELALANSRADNDPEGFINALKNQELNLPSRQVVPDFPQLEFDKSSFDDLTNDEKPHTEQHTLSSDGQTKVRGRVFTQSKPETFNQLWSCDEQRRLEELLEIYPEEEVESHRYKKIAMALGTRTHAQVHSRVQKYFMKLAKLGLPIPGRGPRRKLCNVHKDRQKQLFPLYKKSTFFPELHVPVKMEDLSESPIKEEPVDHETSGHMELLRQAKEQRLLDQVSPMWQTDVQCVGCQKVGFMGARWTDHSGTDYCTDCIVQLLPQEALTPIR